MTTRTKDNHVAKSYTTAEVKAIDDNPEWPHGGFEAVISTASTDRDNEVLDLGCFNPLPKSIPIFGDHVASVATTVARAVPTYNGNALVARGPFASDEYSQMVRAKVAGGFVTTMSVGFMRDWDALTADPDGVWHTTKGELLEASFVPIPSNRDAGVLMAKSLVGMAHKAGRRNSSTDQEAIQAAHDWLNKAGAECAMDKTDDAPEEGDDGKAVAVPVYKLTGPEAATEFARLLFENGPDPSSDDIEAAYRAALALVTPQENAPVEPTGDEAVPEKDAPADETKQTEIVLDAATGEAATSADDATVAAEPDEDPGKLAMALDQMIDNALTSFAAGSMDEVEATLIGCAVVVDELLEVYGVPDPDDLDEGKAAPDLVAKLSTDGGNVMLDGVVIAKLKSVASPPHSLHPSE